jgi:hypothetical protein
LINNVMVQPPPGVNPLGLQGAIYLKSQGPFWTLSKSQQMFEIVDFWTQYAVEALDVYLEYEHQVGSQQYCNDPPTATGCPLQKWVDYTQTLSDQALATLHDAQGTPLKPLPTISAGPGQPTYGFTVDIRSGLMWCTPCQYYPGNSAFTLDAAVSQLSAGYYDNSFALGYRDFAVPNQIQIVNLLQGCGCDLNHPTGVQWLVNNGVIHPSWLDADHAVGGAKPVNPGHVYVWTTDPGPTGTGGSHYTRDLKTVAGNYAGGYISPVAQYYLPARTPALAGDGPYYP